MNDGRLRVRPPAVAGLFYPSDPDELRAMVGSDLDEALKRLAASASDGGAAATPPHAVIAPHAGYVYSGPVVASAYARVVPRRHEVRRVVLLGPSHRVPLRGMALPTVDALATPLGAVPVDDAVRRTLAGRADVVLDDRPHAAEHSLEVHLPFLQVVLDEGWTLVPVVVGATSAGSVADLLTVVWGGPETLVVVSTDLSHYHPHDTATVLDTATAAAVVACRWRDIEPERACGAHPLRGLLAEAERRHLPVELVDLRTSGDTAGDRDRVVGYGAFTVG